MLEEKDLQAIGVLLSKQLKEQSEQFDEKIAEVLNAVNEGFSEVHEELTIRPTKDEMFSWADRRITDLEIGKERHDYLHIDELDKLPAPQEINRVLIERGFKQKLA
ncbi:MAG: hypothetical protein WCK11_05840 [Candidatus Falkowbacteria bacterium]